MTGETGKRGPPGPKGDKGETGNTVTVETVKEVTSTPMPPTGQRKPDICIDVEIIFSEAPANNCTLNTTLIQKSLAKQLNADEGHIQQLKMKIRSNQGKRELVMTFRTTKEVRDKMKTSKDKIKLPLGSCT